MFEIYYIFLLLRTLHIFLPCFYVIFYFLRWYYLYNVTMIDINIIMSKWD